MTTIMKSIDSETVNVAGASPSISRSEDGDQLKLVLGDFAGPLDLLLYLIRLERVSIYDIPVAKITDEYLRYLRLMHEMDIAVASDFLVMAATLIEIKSKMILPPDSSAETGETEEDPRSELVERLLEYRKYKAAAEMLWSRATVAQAVFTRGVIDSDQETTEVAASVFDILKVFQEILARHEKEIELEIVREEITMAEMIKRIRSKILSGGEFNLRTMFEEAQTRREMVVLFLTILELVRDSEILIKQSEAFGDIIARAA